MRSISVGSTRKGRKLALPFIGVCFFIVVLAFLYMVWSPGAIVTDGRHDRDANGIWIQHGWLGDDAWFKRTRKNPALFRNQESIAVLRTRLQEHHIRDVYPHLCPSSADGVIPDVDHPQTLRFLEAMQGFRVMPWVGGVLGKHVSLESPAWRGAFINSALTLLKMYPQFAGIHINIEPITSGNVLFLTLLEEIRAAMPQGKIISVAAYPPPTLWHPFPAIHWDKDYFQKVSARVDQMAVMMYDTAMIFEKPYISLMTSWTEEVVAWAGKTEILLGIPVYDDSGVDYHHPKVENLKNALKGIHVGLAGFRSLPANYQGVAIYSEWEMDEGEWEYFREHFTRSRK
jgi:hypothetical protein